MQKQFAEEIEIWAIALPLVLVLPLVIVFGAVPGLIATAGLWLLLRSVALITETAPERHFDPAQLQATLLLQSIAPPTPEGVTSLTEAFAQATLVRDADDVETDCDDGPTALRNVS